MCEHNFGGNPPRRGRGVPKIQHSKSAFVDSVVQTAHGHSDSVYTLRGNGSPADAFLRTPSQKSDPESGIY